MLCFERVFDGLVKLLVAAGSLCGVEVTAADDMAVGGGEVEGLGNGLEVGERDELWESRMARSAEDGED